MRWLGNHRLICMGLIAAAVSGPIEFFAVLFGFDLGVFRMLIAVGVSWIASHLIADRWGTEGGNY